MTVAALIVAGTLTAWILGWWVGRSENHLTRSCPRRLFLGLCRAHGLTWGDRRLMWRLARLQGLESPGRLFLEPERFDPAHLAAKTPKLQARYEVIRGLLFKESEVRGQESEARN
jgi:hypothetical protein